MAERNVAIEPALRMQFRIGINIGEVIYDEARIYGDGINVAARLEGIAEPGGICISSKVYEEISGRVDFPARISASSSSRTSPDQYGSIVSGLLKATRRRPFPKDLRCPTSHPLLFCPSRT